MAGCCGASHPSVIGLPVCGALLAVLFLGLLAPRGSLPWAPGRLSLAPYMEQPMTQVCEGPQPAELVPEVAAGCEDHCYACFLAGFDHLGVALGAAGLDDGFDAGVDGRLWPVREREEGVRGHH